MRYRPSDKTVPEDPFEWICFLFDIIFDPVREAIVEPILGEPFSEKWRE